MRKVIEYTLVSLDGVFEDASRFMEYRDDAYMRDGLGQLLACDAMLMGRTTKLEKAEWNNSTIVRGDVAAEVTKLKQQDGGNLLIWGHGLLGETLLKERLIDVIDLSIHPVVVGHGKLFFRENQNLSLRLVATKSFTKGIVKLTYEPHY